MLNLDDTIAVTQNFVDQANLANVAEYLRYSDCALHDRCHFSSFRLLSLISHRFCIFRA